MVDGGWDGGEGGGDGISIPHLHLLGLIKTHRRRRRRRRGKGKGRGRGRQGSGEIIGDRRDGSLLFFLFALIAGKGDELFLVLLSLT